MKSKFDVFGMTCEMCKKHIENSVFKLNGIESCQVNLISNKMTVTYKEDQCNTDMIVKAVVDAGYSARVESNNNIELKKEHRKKTAQFVSSLILLIPLLYFSMIKSYNTNYPKFLDDPILYFAVLFGLSFPILIINRSYFIRGFKSLFQGSPTMDTLISIGSLSSFLYATYSFTKGCILYEQGDIKYLFYLSNKFFDSSAMILTIVTLGKMLESRAKKLTYKSIEKLALLLPEYATILQNDTEVNIKCEEIQIGDIIVVKTGTVVPVDGVIIEGEGTIDMASMTGESIPRYVKDGDNVISSGKVINGFFKMKALTRGVDSKMKRLIERVNTAAESRSQTKITRIADKVSAWFVPAVLVISLLTFIIWFGVSKDVTKALQFAVSVLVISCPCALGLATPIAITASVGKGASLGILYKNAVSIEIGSNVNTVVIDKTGTITKGEPEVVRLSSYGISEEELVDIIYSLEDGTKHPLSNAVSAFCKKKNGHHLPVEEYAYIPKCGLKGKIKGDNYRIGTLEFIQDITMVPPIYSREFEESSQRGNIPLLIAKNNTVIGMIVIIDEIKPSSNQAIIEFNKLNVKSIMATGDNPLTSFSIGQRVGITNVQSQVLPQEKEIIILKEQYGEKAYVVKDLIDSLEFADEKKKIEIYNKINEIKKLNKVAMIGDGINDSLALIRSDLGIAIGNGSDIAVDCADVILLKSDLLDAVNAVRLARRTVKTIYINLIWAFAYNVICIPLSAGILSNMNILLNPMISSLFMCLSSIFVVCTALTINLFKPIKYDSKYYQPSKDLIKQEMKEKEKIIMDTIVKVDDMMCEHCVKRVKDAIMKLPNVTNVSINLPTKEVTISYSEGIDINEVQKAVEDAGYKYIG